MSRQYTRTAVEYLEDGSSISNWWYTDGKIKTSKVLRGPSTNDWTVVVNWMSDIIDNNKDFKISYVSMTGGNDADPGIRASIEMTKTEEPQEEKEEKGVDDG